MDAQSERSHITETVASLPLAEHPPTETLNEQGSLAAMHDLETINPNIPERTLRLSQAVLDEILEELEDLGDGTHFVVTHQELHGAIHRATRRGATQTAFDLGLVLRDIQRTEETLGLVVPLKGDTPEPT